jgi:hypothetical protein
MGRPSWIAILIALAATSGIAAAHGMPPAPAHGGRVLEANENWVELVLAGDRVRVYVLDEARKPIPAAKLAGSATILVGGKPFKVTLSPGTANELDAGLAVAAGAKDAAAVSLTIEGQRAAARFPAGS